MGAIALLPTLVVAQGLQLGLVTDALNPATEAQIVDAITSTWIAGWNSDGANQGPRKVTIVSGNGLPQTDLVLGPAEIVSAACNSGALVPTSIRTQMRTGSLFRRASAGCGVAIVSRQTHLAFRRDAFETETPQVVDALFDVETYPGKRALVAGPDTIIEWALKSYGVPHQDLYELLSTERGLKLVFRRLERIREHTIWCKTRACARDTLMSGEASMAMLDHDTGAALRGDSALGFVDSAAIVDHLELAVTDGSRTNEASEFADFAESDAQIEAFSRHAGLAGPSRGADTLVRDSAWYARTRERLLERFTRWLGAQAVRAD